MAYSGFEAAPADFAAAAPRLAAAADALAAAAAVAAAALADCGAFWGEDGCSGGELGEEFGVAYLADQREAADLGARCEQALRAMAEQLTEAGAAYARAEAVAVEGLHCAALRLDGQIVGLVR